MYTHDEDVVSHDEVTQGHNGPFNPASPTKHRRHRRRVGQDLRHAVADLNTGLATAEDLAETADELDLVPHRKERVNDYDPS